MPAFLGIVKLVDFDALQIISVFTCIVVWSLFHSHTNPLGFNFSLDKLLCNLTFQKHSYCFLASDTTLLLVLHIQSALLFEPDIYKCVENSNSLL